MATLANARSPRHRSRRRGRPARAQDRTAVREALLEAARALFSHEGFDEVGIRDIAKAAGVNLAMIRYYFGDKHGLYAAMLEASAERLLDGLREVAAQPPGESSAAESFLQFYIGTLTREPWIPRLIVREVLSERAPLRQMFIERFASQAALLGPGLMRREIERGSLREDLDPVLTILSLVGMSAFPFLAFPVIARVINLKLDQSFRDRLIAHT